MRRYVGYVWAAPVTLPALAIGLLCVLFGRSRLRVQDGVFEFFGGAIGRALDIGLPGIGGMPAMTLGHVVWYRNRRELRRWRRHELVHVRQFEIWGGLLVPAFYVSAVWLILTGRHPYYDNPFELEAYGKVAFPHAVEGLPRPAVVAVSRLSPAGKQPVLGLQPIALRTPRARPAT